MRDEPDWKRCLMPEMAAEVGFAHRCDRMAAHGVAINPVNLTIWSRSKEISLMDEATKMRCADKNRYNRRTKSGHSELNRPADTSVCG